MSEVNQYQAPQSQVDQQGTQEYSKPKIFGTSGRIGRLRFLAYSVGVNLILSIPQVIAQAFLTTETTSQTELGIIGGVGIILLIIQIVFYFMFAIQRSHDMNTSGWLSLIILIPIIGVLIFLFVPGTKGDNRFGHPPPSNGVGVILLALLMPIIGFIGILAAIAIPAYNGYLEQARQSEQEQMQQQQNLEELEQQQNNN